MPAAASINRQVAGSLIGVYGFGRDGSRDLAIAWSVDEGSVEGVDVSGLAFALSASSSDSRVRWRTALYVDEEATRAQHDALLKVVTGQFGGPIGEIVSLVDELGAIQRAPIRLDLGENRSSLVLGSTVRATLHRGGARLQRFPRHGLEAVDASNASGVSGRFHIAL
jgi:uncharacterized protein DUF1326